MPNYSLDIQGKQVCFQYSGSGAPILLLHASPLSSNSLIPLVDMLSDEFTVFAIDTPGYGKSQNPDIAPEHISYYSEVVHQIIEQLNIDKAAIYGTATGAQIAIRYALEHKDNVANLFLDNTAHFTEDERNSIMENYFPNFEVKPDGSHLQAIWHTVDNLFKFFPWCNQTEEYRLKTPTLPPAILDKVMIDYLISGKEYDWAYKLAFMHEDKKHIQALEVPTTIFRWEGSIIKKYNDRLFESTLPDNVKAAHIPATDQRYRLITEVIKEQYQSNIFPQDYIFDEKAESNYWSDISLPNFPESAADGSHWAKAWIMLDALSEGTGIENHEQKNQLLIHWASR